MENKIFAYMRISTNHKTQKTDRQRQAMPFVKCSYSVKDCLQAVADGNPAFLAVLGCANFICACAIVMVYAMFRLADMKFSVCYTVPSQGSCLTYPQSRMKADLNSVVCHVKGVLCLVLMERMQKRGYLSISQHPLGTCSGSVVAVRADIF